VLTFAQTGRGKDPLLGGEPPPGPLRHPYSWGDRAENQTRLPTPLFTRPSKNPHGTTQERVLSTRFPHLRGALWASGNPLPETKQGFAQQSNLAAQLTVVAHLPFNLGAGVDDGRVVTPAQGRPDSY